MISIAARAEVEDDGEDRREEGGDEPDAPERRRERA